MTATTKTSKLLDETHWEKAAKTRMGKYLTEVETDFIRASIDLSLVHSMIDVGAEAGRFSQLSSSAETMVSIDIDSNSLRRLRQKMRKVDVVQADARHVPFTDGAFDVIFMIEVLDYIPNLDIAMSESCRILRSGKSLIVSFGNRSSLKAKLREIGGKSYQHSFKNVKKSLQLNGFKIEKKTGYNWLPFGRMSNNPLVQVLACVEKIAGFRKTPSLSPWAIIKATKK